MVMNRKWSRWLIGAIACAVLAVLYVRANPLVFNESLWTHAHCIKIAGLELEHFAAANGGKYPRHPRGYGNALLLLSEGAFHTLTGPGYTAKALHEAKRNNRDLSEEECGRVYVQGLTVKSDGLALLFDKRPTPGGDHCHFPARLWAPLGREVWLVGGPLIFVKERSWPQFAQEQVELLVNEGIPREAAERLFASAAK
jgi:hypothetical protein